MATPKDTGRTMNATSRDRRFPVASGIFFGLGLGGFFDGIVLHQILQWHHMLSHRYEVNTLENLEFNTVWDGLFHSLTYVFVVTGLVLLWRSAQRKHLFWSSKRLIGSVLIGFGLFNVVEGLVNHHLLQLHHVNETVPRTEWIYWDIGFLVWGAAMIAAGRLILSAGKRQAAEQQASGPNLSQV
jgi:uncharacterized membrane protein